MKMLDDLLKNSWLGQKVEQISDRLNALDDLRVRVDDLRVRLERLEIFSHGARATFVGNNRVLLKSIVADNQIAFFVEADDRLLSPWFIVTGGYETDLTNFFLSHLKPDSHCIDVGSNFGFFTCLMARFCPNGRVIGIEPDHHVFELARDNTLINGFAHATVLHAAAGNETGMVTLHRRNTRSGNTSIASVSEDCTTSLGEAPSVPFTVQGIRIDDIRAKLDGRVDFMKIDVEGAEPLVFQGARRTIADNPQITIVVEWSPGQMAAAGFAVPAFISELTSLGLTPFDLSPGGLKALSADELAALPYRAGIVLKRRESLAN